MEKTIINRINYKNLNKQIDFEIVDLQLFFASRPKKMLESDYRVNFWSLIYIIAGSGHHYIDFESYAYQKGNIIFIQKNQVHRFVINNQVQGYIININEPFFYTIEDFTGDVFLKYLDQFFNFPILEIDTSKTTTNRTLVELLHQEYSKNDQIVNQQLIAALFQALILALWQQTVKTHNILISRDYEIFKEYRQLVEKHYTTTRKVETYAKMMGFSRKTINQVTRKVTGLTAKQYINNRITLEIKRYLSQGKLMNYEIADLMGFSDAANMTKFFKNYAKKAPKEFKNSIKFK